MVVLTGAVEQTDEEFVRNPTPLRSLLEIIRSLNSYFSFDFSIIMILFCEIGAVEQTDEELVHHPPSLRALHHPQRNQDVRYLDHKDLSGYPRPIYLDTP